MKAYYGSRFSPNMTKTPEGFLVCHNSPIARTGWYEYLGQEIGEDDKNGQIVQVFRGPEEVFSPVAISSFNGKTVTNEHPNNLIDSNNNNSVDMGDVTNVRRGTGENSDLLLADLIIKDSTLISAVEQGKREISCGYDCIYDDNGDGTYSQKQICGNHVAVVGAGRAGKRVSIKDSKIKEMEGEIKMGNPIKLPRKRGSISSFLQAYGLKHFATDAEPTDIMDAMEDLQSEKEEKEKAKGKDAEPEAVTKEKEKKEEPVTKDAESTGVESRLTAIENMLKKLTEKKEDKAEDSIDAAISELEKSEEAKDDDSEESQTVPAEEVTDESLVPGVVLGEEDRPKNPLKSADSIAMLRALKAMKPVIANMKDPKAKKQACDSLLAEFKKAKKGNGKNGYSNILKAQKEKVAKDSKATNDAKAAANEKIGEDIKKRFNPHYKEVK